MEIKDKKIGIRFFGFSEYLGTDAVKDLPLKYRQEFPPRFPVLSIGEEYKKEFLAEARDFSRLPCEYIEVRLNTPPFQGLPCVCLS